MKKKVQVCIRLLIVSLGTRYSLLGLSSHSLYELKILKYYASLKELVSESKREAETSSA